MATLTLEPNGAGDETAIPNLVGAATHWQAVLTDDGNTSYVGHPGGVDENWYRDLYAIENSVDLGEITSVRICALQYFLLDKDGYTSATLRFSLKTHGTVYDVDSLGDSFKYTWRGNAWNTNPNTGNPWTWDEINALQAGISLHRTHSFVPGGRPEVRCTQVYVIVIYSPDLPTVTIQAVTDIDETTATGNGNVTSLGGADVTQHGHCWNTTGTPVTTDDKTTNGAKATTGAFTSSITGLIAGTKYYVRAYATNAAGTSYSGEVTFTAAGQSIVLDEIEIEDDVMYAHYVRGKEEELEKATAGTLEMRLRNDDEKYTPFNTESPLYGSLYPGKKVRLNWEGHTLFTGSMERLVPHPKKDAQDAYMYIIDGMDFLSRAEISTPLYPAYKTGDIINIILDAAGYSSEERVVDDGYTIYSITIWFLEKALKAIQEVESNEQGFFYIDHRGYPIFESRNHRLTAARSKTSQATFTDDDIFDAEFDYGSARVYNDVSGDFINWTVPGVEDELGRLRSENPMIPYSESRTFYLPYSEITDTVIDMEKGTDVQAGSSAGSDNLNDDLTIAQTHYAKGSKIVFTNNSTYLNMYLSVPEETNDGFKIRGEPFVRNEAVKIRDFNQDSIDAHQIRTYTVPGAYFETTRNLLSICERIVHRYKDPQPMMKLTLKNKTDAFLDIMLGLRISDRITVTHTGLYIDEDFFINKIEHTIEEAGKYHTMILTLARAFDEEFFIVGVSSLGLNTRLG